MGGESGLDEVVEGKRDRDSSDFLYPDEIVLFFGFFLFEDEEEYAERECELFGVVFCEVVGEFLGDIGLGVVVDSSCVDEVGLSLDLVDEVDKDEIGLVVHLDSELVLSIIVEFYLSVEWGWFIHLIGLLLGGRPL